jgi:nitrite reductase (cytochrome c-552)
MAAEIKTPRRVPFKRLTLIMLASAGLVAAGLFLFVDISEKKQEERQYPLLLTKLSDDDVSPSLWGQSFPAQYSRYRLMEGPGQATAFGGGVPYSKLIRSPALRRLWAGYPFAADFNEERSHVYSQLDQIETRRNDQEWLNAHGFPAFKGQPGACMNCHSGWAPSLIRELGWETFNKTPYKELKQKLEAAHGEGLQKHALGSTCADCHHPEDMSLRVTRPAYIEAMVRRGYTADAKSGLTATHTEMRSHVCQQCHVEYYFKGDAKTLTFPWNDWPKDEPLRIEMIEAYYDRQAASEGGFKADWTHKETGAPMLKMQHPETELYSSSVHAQSQVSCTDCHMPYRREGALKVTDHFIASPLLDINASCQTCHRQGEQDLKRRVQLVQERTAVQLKETEGAVLALIDDVVSAEAALRAARPGRKELSDQAFEADVAKALAPAREAHRRASMRWDFISSENSTGFHSPQESARVLGAAAQIARSGQLALVRSLKERGLDLSPTAGYGKLPPAGSPIEPRPSPVGDEPSRELRELDQRLERDVTVLQQPPS